MGILKPFLSSLPSQKGFAHRNRLVKIKEKTPFRDIVLKYNHSCRTTPKKTKQNKSKSKTQLLLVIFKLSVDYPTFWFIPVYIHIYRFYRIRLTILFLALRRERKEEMTEKRHLVKSKANPRRQSEFIGAIAAD